MDFSHKNFKTSCLEHEIIPEQKSYDWFSNLPTDILHHILSFLDITEVVKTSMLSRKWRYTWDSLPCLNFDLKYFSKQEHCKRLSYDECVENFWIFVKWTIMIRDASPIYKLRFSCDYFDGYQLDLVFYLCVLRHVQDLYISAGYGVQQCPLYCALPEHIEAITENISYLFELEPIAGFWNLKTLHLVGVRFPDADITTKLFSDCGVLENLSVECCCFLMIKFLKISANKLRNLNFVNHGLNSWGRMCMFEGELELHTPNLVSFCYIGPLIRLSASSDLLFLKNASVMLRHQHHPKVPSLDFGTMVSRIHHVEKLSVSAVFVLYYSPAFRIPGRNFTPFDYLRCLKLDLECKPDHIEGLINLLQLSPNLEALHIQLIESWMISSWKSREVDMPCLSRNLEEIEIVGFRDCDPLNLLEIVKFFLQNGKSLERIKITQTEKKVNPERFYALQAVQLASEAVTVSITSTSASGKKELFQIIYGNCGVSVQTKTGKSKVRIRRSLRIAAKKSGGSS